MKTALLTAITALLFVACGTSVPPIWLDDPAASYPEADYLSAVGEAGNRDQSGNRALANLAKIFEVAVQDQSLDFARARVETADGEGTPIAMCGGSVW